MAKYRCYSGDHGDALTLCRRENTVLRAQLDPGIVSVIPNAIVADQFRPAGYASAPGTDSSTGASAPPSADSCHPTSSPPSTSHSPTPTKASDTSQSLSPSPLRYPLLSTTFMPFPTPHQSTPLVKAKEQLTSSNNSSHLPPRLPKRHRPPRRFRPPHMCRLSRCPVSGGRGRTQDGGAGADAGKVSVAGAGRVVGWGQTGGCEGCTLLSSALLLFRQWETAVLWKAKGVISVYTLQTGLGDEGRRKA